jgi:hypothetical protein
VVNKPANVYFVPFQLRNHKWHILVFTKVVIKAGEELLIDYPSYPVHTISMRPKSVPESQTNGHKVEINLQSRSIPSPVNLPSPLSESSPSSVSSGPTSNEHPQVEVHKDPVATQQLN